MNGSQKIFSNLRDVEFPMISLQLYVQFLASCIDLPRDSTDEIKQAGRDILSLLYLVLFMWS